MNPCIDAAREKDRTFCKQLKGFTCRAFSPSIEQVMGSETCEVVGVD